MNNRQSFTIRAVTIWTPYNKCNFIMLWLQQIVNNKEYQFDVDINESILIRQFCVRSITYLCRSASLCNLWWKTWSSMTFSGCHAIRYHLPGMQYLSVTPSKHVAKLSFLAATLDISATVHLTWQVLDYVHLNKASWKQCWRTLHLNLVCFVRLASKTDKIQGKNIYIDIFYTYNVAAAGAAMSNVCV